MEALGGWVATPIDLLRVALTAARYGHSGRDEFTWAALTNSTHAQPQLDLDLDTLMWQLVMSVNTMPRARSLLTSATGVTRGDPDDEFTNRSP